MKRVEGILREQDRYADTFYNIGEHAPVAGIRAGADLFKSSGADIIVSIGGGSPIDASKAIIYFVQKDRGGEFPRQIAIPTTLSAAEYSVRGPPRQLCSDTDLAKDRRRIYRRERPEGGCELALSCSCWHHPRRGTHASHPGKVVVSAFPTARRERHDTL